MRRLSLVLPALTSLTLFGCNALRDAFSSRADVVARANGQTLTVERLGGWAGGSKEGPPGPMSLTPVSRCRGGDSPLAGAAAARQEPPHSRAAGAAEVS